MSRVLLLALAAACCPDPVATKRTTPVAGGFDALAATVMQHILDLEPQDAISAGLHDHDGKLPDRSAAGLAAEIAALQGDRSALEAIAPAGLTERQRDEREVLLRELRGQLFELVELDTFHRNPMSYFSGLSLDAYIVRDYAPAAQRADAVIATCKQIPAYLAQAHANITAPIPRTWIDTALMQTTGMVKFVDKDIRAQLPQAPALDAALDGCATAFREHAAWLEAQVPRATSAFALGTDTFLRMLAQTQDVVLDLPRLRALAEADLARNSAALAEAAHAIDPDHPVAEVVAAQAAIKPADVLATATEQAAMLRAFLVDKHIVTVPGDAVAEVRVSPEFRRWNAAFLDGPGPFETRRLPSFYYISPPDPTWPEDVQRAYIPPKADLLFTTVHEVYPGHFLHGLHIRRNPSRILQVFGTYSTSEGWAHYTEEMMFDAGAGDHTPQARIGMLKEALLRNVRFVVALGEHTGGMTVAEAQTLFEQKAYVDPGNAKQQAVRGTFDPMFLSYTLGKLMIRKLHADWMAKHPDATLQQFHDAFLAHASAPIPVTRRDLLGDDSTPL